jgi:nitrous oxidase accessory protein NosD
MRSFLPAILIQVLPLAVEAKELYVNGFTGSDATSYAANDANNPWSTIGRAAWGSTNSAQPNAAQAAQAGDTVRVEAGTYATVGTDSRYLPAYNPANSGTLGNPITFQAEGLVVLTLSSSRGAVIGSYQRNHLVWKGFTIDEANAPSRADTGPVTIFSGTGVRIEDCHINGNGNPGYGDNHTGIRIEGSVDVTVRNNRIHNIRTSVVNPVNGAGVQVYESKGLLIEHNEIFDVGSGIFLKAVGYTNGQADPAKYSNQQDVIRYNLIHDASYGIVHHRHRHSASTVYFLAHQNLIRGSSTGIAFWGFDVGDGPTNGRFINNTLDGCEIGVYLKASVLDVSANMLVQNNLITNSSTFALFNDGSLLSWQLARSLFERNWYWSYPAFMEDIYTARTFAQFTSLYPGQEMNATDGVNPNDVDCLAPNFRRKP